MLLVVLLHVSAVSFMRFHTAWDVALIYDSISRVSVPLFFILSGYLLLDKKESVSVFFIKRASKIFIPFLFWTVLYKLYVAYYTKSSFDFNVLNIITTPAYYHLWFLYAIIIMYLMTPALRLIISNGDSNIFKYMLISWFFVVCVYSCILQVNSVIFKHGQMLGDGHLDTYIYLSGYYFIGGVIKKTSSLIFKRRVLLNLFLFSTLLTILLTWATSNYIGHPTEVFFVYISPLVVIASICLFLCMVSIDFNFPKRINFLISSISSKCFCVYLVHLIVLESMARYIGFDLWGWDVIYVIPLLSLFCFSISFIISQMVSKVPLLNRVI